MIKFRKFLHNIHYIALLLVFLAIGCNNTPSYIEGNTEGSVLDIRYIKDSRTGLCFATRGRGSGYSFTCVPCDSLVLLKIK